MQASLVKVQSVFILFAAARMGSARLFEAGSFGIQHFTSAGEESTGRVLCGCVICGGEGERVQDVGDIELAGVYISFGGAQMNAGLLFGLHLGGQLPASVPFIARALGRF